MTILRVVAGPCGVVVGCLVPAPFLSIRVLAKKWQLDAVEVYLDHITLNFPDNDSPDSDSIPGDTEQILPKPIGIEPVDQLTWIFHLADYKLFTHELIECFKNGK